MSMPDRPISMCSPAKALFTPTPQRWIAKVWQQKRRTRVSWMNNRAKRSAKRTGHTFDTTDIASGHDLHVVADLHVAGFHFPTRGITETR